MPPPYTYRRRSSRGRRRRARLQRILTYTVSAAAFVTACLLAWAVYDRSVRSQEATWARFVASDEAIPIRRPQPLGAEEARWAATAWRYFERHTSPRTGLPASVAGGRTVTMYDTGSYLLAAIAAHRLGLIEVTEYNDRMSRLLESLATMPLFEGALPNHTYDIQRLSMIGRRGDTDLLGTGWSAVDLSRLLLGFKIMCWEYPYFTPQVRDILGRWRLDYLVVEGHLQGAHLSRNERVVHHREGRLGAEEYAARVLGLYNFDTYEAAGMGHHTEITRIDGVDVAVDTRPSFPLEGLNIVTSDPYLHLGLELGWDRQTLPVAFQVYRAMRQRAAAGEAPVAVGTGYLGQPAERVHCAVVADQRAWTCVDDAGTPRRDALFVSTAAAIGWGVLFETDYARALFLAAESAMDARHGWATGYYAHDQTPIGTFTAHTNALVLEAVHYLTRGPMLDLGGDLPEGILTENRSDATPEGHDLREFFP